MQMPTDRKASILEAFMKLVSRFGVDKTTMQDVAKEAGISVGVIYKDFENKEELIYAYAQNLHDQLMSQCQTIFNQSKQAEELLHELILNYFNYSGMLLAEDHGFYQFLSDNASFKFFQHHDFHKNLIRQEMTGMIGKIIAKGIEEKVFEVADVQSAALHFYQAFNIFTLEMVFEKKSLEEVLSNVEQMYQFLIKAILKR